MSQPFESKPKTIQKHLKSVKISTSVYNSSSNVDYCLRPSSLAITSTGRMGLCFCGFMLAQPEVVLI